jgi:hypothetical protein
MHAFEKSLNPFFLINARLSLGVIMPENSTKQTGPTTDELLKILVAIGGRIVTPPEELREIVSPRGAGKYVDAYNLCDGTRGIAEVARAVGIDKSNLNKSVNRWVDEGVLFKIGDARNFTLLHMYRLNTETDQTTNSVTQLNVERVGTDMRERGGGKKANTIDSRGSRAPRPDKAGGIDEAAAGSGDGALA